MSENNQAMSAKPHKEREARSKQKLKLFYVLEILREYTDENHDITVDEIISKLKLYDVTAERKSIYDDMNQLREAGFTIDKKQYGKTFHYKLTNGRFKLSELKLLVDSIQAAKFITEEESNGLIKKLKGLTCKASADQLSRQISVPGRVKTKNVEVLENVDKIHSAIGQDIVVKFQYYQWNLRKEPELRHDGMVYEVSPWGLVWDDENYYMVGYDKEANEVKNYRVDKMIKLVHGTSKREGRDHFDKLDMGDYAKKRFGMFHGEEQRVDLLCENWTVGIIIDRFGQDVKILKADENHFKTSVKIAVSPLFIGWLNSLGGIKIIGPDKVVKQVKEEVQRLADIYLS